MHPLEQSWYRTDLTSRLLCLILWPLSVLFGALAGLRRTGFRLGLLRKTRLPVPVVVIGNITAGGTGKTPLTIALGRSLKQRHKRPGIVCRGYGGTAKQPQAVLADSNPQVTGDEAVLLARHSGCPVWIGADRVAAAVGLLAANPDCDLLLSDDGLQHYALERNFEIAVIDAARGFGNRRLLPSGPLREPLARLASVDAVVLNGVGSGPQLSCAVYRMNLRGERFRNLATPQHSVNASYFAGRKTTAIAAIGNPQRFFDHLSTLGIDAQTKTFPDHHAYTPADLAFSAATEVIMTDKDAVKCERFAGPTHWSLEVEAELDGDLSEHIVRQLGVSP